MAYEDAAIKKRRTFELSDGRTVQLSQLGMRSLDQLKKEALRQYRREQIEAWTDNKDLLPEDKRDSLIQDAIRRASEISAADLPKQEIDFPVLDDKGKVVRENGEMKTRRIVVPYTAWWISETHEGKLQSTYLSIREVPGQEHYTIKDVDDIFRDAIEDLESAANIVGEISKSQIGDDAKKNGASKREMRRERRRKRRTGR